MRKKLLWLCVLLSSCTVYPIKKSVKDSNIFNQGHIGFMLLDPEKNKTIYALNEDKYFIPASNTKLFTFYTSYKVLGDGFIDGLNYIQKEDSLLFWGTGDPSLLHPDFKNTEVLEFLKNAPQSLYFVNTSEQVTAFGPGWSWDWYNYYYATERSAFPVYGNVVRFSKKDAMPDWDTYPNYFLDQTIEDPLLQNGFFNFQRSHLENRYRFFVNKELDSLAFETDKPFITSAELTADMLSRELGKPVTVLPNDGYHRLPHQKLPTAAVDSIYSQMMKISDNFLAEQLMLMVSDKLFDSLDIANAIRYTKENLLNDLPDEPKWYDGSGLSARNMFTPRSIIALLLKIREEVPMEKIRAYFPAGGDSGTIRNWYKADTGEPPYIYAKTGTLSMSNALSGFLFAKSGKVLVFSFLLNNYAISSDDLKKEIEKVLYFIYDRY